jgi:hypothetical protein
VIVLRSRDFRPLTIQPLHRFRIVLVVARNSLLCIDPVMPGPDALPFKLPVLIRVPELIEVGLFGGRGGSGINLTTLTGAGFPSSPRTVPSTSAAASLKIIRSAVSIDPEVRSTPSVSAAWSPIGTAIERFHEEVRKKWLFRS